MSWIQRLFGRGRLYDDLSQEMRQHLEEKRDELMAQGMSHAEAEAAARREFGNVTSLEEQGRETWRWPRLESLFFDVRFAVRQLRREPSFTIVAVLILGLGIGATTSVFSLVNSVLLRPLPFKAPDRLVKVSNTGEEGDLSSLTSRSSNLRDWREMSETFEDLGGYFAFFDYNRFTLTGKGEPERLIGVGVTETFLPVLGVEPMLGRHFTPEECVFNGRPAILLTHDFWERRFASDPAIVGQALELNDSAVTVVGVLPRSFDFATFFAPGARIDFLEPFPVSKETDRWGNTLAVIGRLAPGATAAQAQEELDLINERLRQADPNRWGLGAAVTELRENLTGKYRDALYVLSGAVGMVLLIACTNLSNLLLARSSARRKEIAVRSAVGAGRRRVVRQLLTESLLLAGFGGAFGVALAYVMTRAVASTQAVTIPLLHSAGLDLSALGFSFAVVVGTGLLFGIAPALQASASKEYDALRDAGRGLSDSKERAWVRNGLVVFEAALACVLLVGAGLLLRSFVKILDSDLGFRPEQRIAWRVETGRSFKSGTERIQFYQRLMERVGAIPGVQSLGLTDTLPLGRNRSWGFGAKGAVYREGEYPGGFPRIVSAGYLESMGIPLLSGRTFDASDTEESKRIVVINEAAARRLWPDRGAVGQILINQGEWEVIGVVENVRHGSLEEEGGLEIYFPITQQGDWNAADLVLRSSLPPETLVPSVRAALREIDPEMATGEFQTLNAVVDRAASPRRFIVSLLGGFAAAAVVLAALGIYGVISYSVNRRKAEIGIRMALGAPAGRVRGAVLGQTMRLALSGIGIGILGAIGLSSLLASQLFGVSPRDPLTYLGVATMLIAVALASGYVPALRASRVSPMTALRAD